MIKETWIESKASRKKTPTLNRAPCPGTLTWAGSPGAAPVVRAGGLLVVQGPAVVRAVRGAGPGTGAGPPSCHAHSAPGGRAGSPLAAASARSSIRFGRMSGSAESILPDIRHPVRYFRIFRQYEVWHAGRIIRYPARKNRSGPTHSQE